MESLQHAKAIFRFSGFGPGREECRYDDPLAVNLVLAEFGPAFGRLESSYPKGGFHLTTYRPPAQLGPTCPPTWEQMQNHQRPVKVPAKKPPPGSRPKGNPRPK